MTAPGLADLLQRISDDLADMKGQRRPLSAGDRAVFLAEVDVEDPNSPTGKRKRALWETQVCSHCGGLHMRACPRVRRMEFVSGQLSVVEFWAWGEWPTDDVVWPEEILAGDGDPTKE